MFYYLPLKQSRRCRIEVLSRYKGAITTAAPEVKGETQEDEDDISGRRRRSKSSCRGPRVLSCGGGGIAAVMTHILYLC